MRWITSATVVALVAGTLSVVPPAAGSAPPKPPPQSSDRPAAASSSYRITLVTGDRLLVTRTPGRPDRVVFQPVPGSRSTSAVTTRWGDHTLVVPSAAAADVRSGKLDRALFDVETLIAQRYDDQRSATLPVIVEYAGTKATANTRARAGVVGATKSRPLTSLGARAAMLRRSTTFYAELPGTVRRVTLDHRVRAALDRSVPQIGVPAAWQRGLTGKGIKIAVLDGGVDATHPDLAGRVTSQNFTDSPDAGDHEGHGTHVASIAAGNGTASGGKYKGVAPEATILNGKVLDDFGFGFESGIVAGMEWAAAQGATVANLSLGSFEPSDGTDSLSQSLNELSRTTRTLYVVAAGNNGPGAQTVTSPGAADAALTVGSNDRDGAISFFSSRGPRKNDGGLKPEITAPGDGIVAARAAGTSLGDPVDDSYAALSGTSMATPHVTGVAALLAQRHPDWTGEQLKTRLIATADPQTGSTVSEQGAGRVDADQATDGSVSADPATIDPGVLRWPFPADDAVARTITYTNPTQAPVTLQLAAQMQPGAPAPTLSTGQVTVPAGGQTSVTVTVNRGSAGAGTFAGRITATPANGDPLVTIIGWLAEPESYDLTVTGINADGSKAGADLSIARPDGGPMPDLGPFGVPMTDGTAKIRLPAGVYYVGSAFYLGATDTRRTRYTMVATPQIRLNRDTTTTLDARKGKAVRATVDGREDAHKRTFDMTYLRTDRAGLIVGGAGVGGSETVDLYAAPTTEPSIGGSEFSVGARLEQWPYRARVVGGPAVTVSDYEFGPRFTGTKTLGLVDAGTAAPADLAGVRGKLALIRRTEDTAPGDQAYAAQQAGAAAVMLYDTTYAGDFAGFWYFSDEELPVTIPVMAVSRATAAGLQSRLASGPVRITVTGVADTAYTYDLLVAWDRIPARPQRTLRQRDFATIDESFGTHVAGLRGQETRFGSTSVGGQTGGWLVPTFGVPYRRTSYVQTGRLTWSSYVVSDSGGDNLTLISADEVFGSPTHTSKRFLVPIANSSEPSTGYVATTTARVQGGLSVNSCPFAYGPDVHDGCFSSAGEFALTVSRDGEVIASEPTPGTYLDIPAKAGAYRVELDAKRDLRSWRYSTAVHTVWDFHSDGSEDEIMPVLYADLGVPQANLLNQVRTGKPATITLGLRHQTSSRSSRIATPVLEISYDGSTWAPLALRKTGSDKYAATVTHPVSQAGKSPSLRITATDAAGGKMVQRIDKAYGLIG